MKGKSTEEKDFDSDLDVSKLLEAFPQDEENSVIYIRARTKIENGIETFSGFVLSRSTLENMPKLFLLPMLEKKEYALAVFDAILNYFTKYKDEIPMFRRMLEKVEKVEDGITEVINE